MTDLEHGWIVESYEEEDIIVHECSWCGSPIYEGDYVYHINGEHICEDCIKEAREIAEK